MNLQNGYKVLYAEAADGMRTFKASKTGVFADAVPIGESFEIGKYKLIYTKEGQIYGSETGVPTEDDYCFDAFNEIFMPAEETETTVTNNDTEKPTQTNPTEVEEDQSAEVGEEATENVENTEGQGEALDEEA